MQAALRLDPGMNAARSALEAIRRAQQQRQ